MDILTKTLRERRSIIIIIIVGTIAWSLTMIKSGLCWGGDCANGLGFWGPNGHDGIWHIAVINSLSRGSLEMPIFPPEEIRNYHIGFDLMISIIHKLTLVPVTTLYFQIIPIILALMIGITAHLFVSRWANSNKYTPWALFLLYFGGSLGWLTNLARSKGIDGESLFWSQQSISTLINPPFALSLVIMFTSLWLLVVGLKKNVKYLLFIVSILFGLLIQIKAYSGILVIVSLLVSGLYLVFQKRDFRILRVFIGTLIVSLILFLPMNKGSINVFEFRPFWFVQTLFEFPDRFYWPRMASAIANYQLAGRWLNLTLALIVGFGIFIVGNFAIRLMSILYFVTRKNKLDWVDIFIGTLIIAGIIAPLLFVQTGTVWNTVQFMYYSLIFSGILTGIYVTSLIQKTSKIFVRVFTAVIIVIITIPTSIATLRFHYLPSRPPAMISANELEALEFLSDQPTGIVLTQPFDLVNAMKAESNPPRPLYLYESTAYVSAYSDKPVYLEDEVNLNITGYNWRPRREKLIKYFEGDNLLFENSEIKYIYLLMNNEPIPDLTKHEIIYQNEEVVILKV